MTTTANAQLLGAPDEAHVAFAKAAGRVIVTNDSDFLSVAAQESDHCGIAFCVPGKRTLGEIIRHLALMHDVMQEDEMHGQIEYL